jgi:hypothetical protein
MRSQFHISIPIPTILKKQLLAMKPNPVLSRLEQDLATNVQGPNREKREMEYTGEILLAPFTGAIPTNNRTRQCTGNCGGQPNDQEQLS